MQLISRVMFSWHILSLSLDSALKIKSQKKSNKHPDMVQTPEKVLGVDQKIILITPHCPT